MSPIIKMYDKYYDYAAGISFSLHLRMYYKSVSAMSLAPHARILLKVNCYIKTTLSDPLFISLSTLQSFNDTY